MKFRILIVLMLMTTAQLFSQGIEFFHGTWEEALEEAKQQEKVIFIDAYATWCGPCKRMAREVFPNEKVGEYFNRHFINMKLDMEKGEGLTFRKAYPVSAFPTLYFIDGNGAVVEKVRGAQDVDGFLKLGEKVLGLADNSEEYAAEYEKGSRGPELMYKYVKALNKSGKSSLRIANEYLDSQEDLNTEFNLRFIFESAIESDSKIFSLMMDKREAIEGLVGQEAVREQVYRACQATVNKAIEFETEALLDEAIDKMKRHYPEKADAFELSAQMDFYRNTGDVKNFSKACKKYAKKVAAGNPDELNKLSSEIVKQFGKDEGAMKQAEELAREAAEKGQQYQYYLNYAQILYINGKQGESGKAANTALELARSEGPAAVMMVERFIQQSGL
ncbi:MAG: thioredoxin family protein [Lewinellaceae bacterium]|nr:thioredoxin family protein [Phaeodactylibacter sp.]MCB0614123.1 thioredoxin family protein [Phaeodactylibacter sp.]MCB9348039.1 thioredoxin family protein [Lewinellaceae bacterium]